MSIKYCLIFAALLAPFYLSAQCSGNITLKDQTDVNKFPCSEFTSGTLTISGINITDLSPLDILQVVGGTLNITDNANLTSLHGLHKIEIIDGDLNIVNNAQLTSFGSEAFGFTSIGNSLLLKENPNLQNNGHFKNLVTVKTMLTIHNSGIMDGFEALFDCQRLEIIEYPGNVIEGFNNLQELRILNIEQSANLEAIQGFNNLEKVTSTGATSILQIKNNTNLDNVDGLSSLQDVDQINVAGNSSLQDCCILLTPILNGPSNVNINGNASGCNSASQINAAPVLASCPSNATVNSSSGSCTASYSLTQPSPSDNCDLSSTSAKLTLADGSIALTGSISSGNTTNYSLQVGVNVFEFAAGDHAGNETSCMATITVEDNVNPVLANCPSDQTINTESNIQCSGTLAYNAPMASDNCSLATYREKWTLPNGSVFADITVSSGQSFNKTFALGASTLDYTAIDADGNVASCSVIVTVVDNKPPTISGIPNSVTISCGEAFPAIPSPTATDICSGNLTSSITVSSSIVMGSCLPGDVAEIQEYSWSVSDVAGNEATGNWKVTVVSDFEFDLGADLSLCGSSAIDIDPGNIGASYEWSTGAISQSISVSSSGTYSLTVTSGNGCCFVDEVNVSIGENPNVSAAGGVLSCTAGSIGLTGSSSTSGVTYGWTGPGGFTSSSPSPSVTSTGTYTLKVTTSNGCTASATAEVTADTDVPDIAAVGGELSCDVAQITISASSSTSGGVYSWTGPGGFNSSQQNPSVSVAGIYTATVTSNNGCSSSADAEVTSDSAGPAVSLSAADLNCEITESTIMVDASSEAQSFSWTGPSSFISEDKQPVVTEVGKYILTTTGSNGCSTTVEIDIQGNYTMPDASATGGTVSCSDNETQIVGSTNTSNPVYSWIGPNDFTSSLQNPFISQPGTYTLTVIAENGCTASAEAIVEGGTDIPVISANGGTINCINETVTIAGTVNVSDATTSWTGPNGFATSNLSAVVDIPGVYTFTVVSGGCQTFVSVNVILDNSEPSFSIGEGIIACNDGVRDFSLVTDAEVATYEWTGPDGFASAEKQPTYSLAGTYNVIINGINGCVSSGSITVDHDIAYSYDIVTTSELTEMIITGGTPPFTILWNDKEEGSSIVGLQLGDNFVRITDGLDCEQFVAFEITSSTIDLNAAEGVKIFPNPVNNLLYLELPELLVNSDLEVINQQGLLMYQGKSEEQLDVRNYSAGIYLMRIRNGNDDYFFKFIKL